MMPNHMPRHAPVSFSRQTIGFVLLTAFVMAGCGGEGAGGGPPIAESDALLPPQAVETGIINGVESEFAEDEVLVFLEEDITNAEVEAVRDELASANAAVVAFDWELRTMQVDIPPGASEESLIRLMEDLSGVAGAHVNAVVEIDDAGIIDNETGYDRYEDEGGEPPSSDAVGHSVPTPGDFSFVGDYWVNEIGAVAGWTALSATTLDATTIGIVDTGIPATQNVVEPSRLTRFQEDGDTLSDDDTPAKTHGLWVTAFAAGYAESGPVRRGVNPHSDVVFVDVYRSHVFGFFAFNTSLLSGIKQAIERGARTVNVSWGDSSKCSDDRTTRIASRQRWRDGLSPAVKYARRRDALVVFSSGNNCEKHDDQLLTSTDDVDVDAWFSHTLNVGASTPSHHDACFSRMGTTVDLVAPGQTVGWGGNETGNGTSYAAPMVTGAAALVSSVNSSLSAPEVRSILLNSASTSLVLSSTSENQAACGSANQVPETTWSASTPTKLLNLDRSVQTALLTQGVELTSEASVSLDDGAVQKVRIAVEVPDEGVNGLDLVFLIDRSGSYFDDIATLQARAADLIADLGSRELSIQFAVAAFSDFPIPPFGSTLYGDRAYVVHQPLTADAEAILAAIEELNNPLLYGDDEPESQYESLYQLATGIGRDVNGDGDTLDSADVPPYDIGWREGALRVVLLATDADFHDSDVEEYPGAGRSEVLNALSNAGIMVVGLQSGASAAAEERLAEVTDHTGGSLHSLDDASSEIAEAIADALDTALAELDVSLETIAGDAWVEQIEPAVHEDVPAGTIVEFDVTLRGQRRRSIADLNYDVYLWARGNESALLQRTRIPILVPMQ
jgi:hypothetical protein